MPSANFWNRQTDMIKKKIQILRRRYALKSKLKQNGSKRKKISVVLMNLDILYYTLKYKIKGYY